MWLISGVSGFSFMTIVRKTSEFKDVGVFANKTFMALYFTFMFTATISSTVANGVEIIADYDQEDLHTV